MIKKIISILITFSMLFAAFNTVAAQELSLPQNYQYLTKELKVKILKDLIADIRLEIATILEKRNSPVETISAKKPFDTRVFLNAIEDIDSEITEDGKINFSVYVAEEENYKKGYLKFALKNAEYRVSTDNKKEIDINFSGKYSFDFYDEEKPAGAKKEFIGKDDYFSLDLVVNKGSIFFKIDGFNNLFESFREFSKKDIEGQRERLREYYSEDEIDIAIEKTDKNILLVKKTIMGRWVEFPLGESDVSSIIGVTSSGLEGIDVNEWKEILKEVYLDNKFIFLSQNKRLSKIKNAVSYNAIVDFANLEKYIEKVYVKISEKIGNKNNNYQKNEMKEILKFIENYSEMDLDFDINDREKIVGEQVDFSMEFNQDDLIKNFSEVGSDGKIDVDLKINANSKIEYKKDIREIKGEMTIEEFMGIGYMLVASPFI